MKKDENINLNNHYKYDIVSAEDDSLDSETMSFNTLVSKFAGIIKTKSDMLILVVSTLVVFAAIAFLIRPADKTNTENVDTSLPGSEIVTVLGDQSPSDIDKWKEIINAGKAVNPDYAGQFVFESGIIDLPFCQGESNYTYIRTNWETMEYDLYGTVFLDYRNTFDDQNLILYGHNVYPSYDPSQTEMFTPLVKLIDEKNYSENRYIDLILDGETRKYEIAYVYYCDLYEDEEGFECTNDSLQYYWTEYSEDYFRVYINAVKQKAFYDTGVEISYDDSFLTLQTCVEYHEDLRLIAVAKLIDTISWE